MPGFNPQQVANKAQNANTVLIQIGDQTIMFAQTLGHTIGFGTQGLYGIGSSKPQEIQQLLMSPSFTLDAFALTEVGEALLQAGVSLNYILAGNQFTMTVLDGIADVPLFIYVGCKCQTFGENVPTNSIIRDNYAFLALDVLDAQGNSIMDTGENALELVVSAGGSPVTGLGVGASVSVGPGGVSANITI